MSSGPPTAEQLSYLQWLLERLGRDEPAPATLGDARNLITRLEYELRVGRAPSRHVRHVPRAGS